MKHINQAMSSKYLGIGSVLALIGTLLWASHAPASQAPAEHLRWVSDGLLGEIRERGDEFRSDEEALFEMVNTRLDAILDEERIVRIVLGKKHYAQASQQQRDDFIYSLRQQVVRLYAKTILTHAHGEIQYLPFDFKADKSFQVVKTEFLLPGRAPVDITYLMREVQGSWRVFEIRAEGIFLIKSLRKSLSPEINENGLDAVIERLRKAASKKESRHTASHAPA